MHLMYGDVSVNRTVYQAAEARTQGECGIAHSGVPTGPQIIFWGRRDSQLSGRFVIDLACGSVLICLSKYLCGGYLCG